jgi:hypothetical protein
VRPFIQIGGTATFTPRRVLLLAPNKGTSKTPQCGWIDTLWDGHEQLPQS